MNKSKFGVLSVAIPMSVALSLALAACGGDDNSSGGGGAGASSGGGKTSTGGSSSSTGGSSSSSGGSTSKAGTSSTGTGNTGNTGSGAGVSGDTPLNELTDDQAQALCEDLGKKLDTADFNDIACKMTSIFAAFMAQSDAEAQTMCKAAYDQCTSSPPDTTQNCEKPGSDCTATVDELNACLDAFSEVYGGIGDQLPSCDTLKLDEIATAFGSLATLMDPAACTAYTEKCPDGPAPPSPADAMP